MSLNLNDGAGSVIQKLLADEEAGEGIAVRIDMHYHEGSDDPHVTLGLDSKREGDLTAEHAGQVVLLAQPNVADWLENKLVDAKITDDGPMFAFLEPGDKACNCC
tara:strand:- start:306 stop:620 length:315 start_codon:yes stop_codon:yes gene_type:complete